MTTFGPQLIGAAEKALDALLHHVLAESGLSASDWVTLRLTAQNDAAVPLAGLVRERAHFSDADVILADLQHRGLLDGETLTTDGHALLTQLQGRIAVLTGPVWAGLDPEDVAATERVLTEVTTRVGRVLESLAA